VFLPKKIDRVELNDRFLQPQADISPLGVSINSKTLIKPNHIIWWNIQGGVGILDLKESKKYTLEDISADIWRLLMQGKSAEAVLLSLAGEYEISEKELLNDAEEFIDSLYRKNILVER